MAKVGFIDGTKIESRANKSTFVWCKNIARYLDKLIEKIKGILRQIDEDIAQDIES